MLQHAVDHVLIREKQIFAYGWGFFPGSTIGKVVLQLQYEENVPCVEIEANYGNQRDDVRDSFPSIPEAANAGFLLFAETSEKKISRAELHWELLDGRVIKTFINLSQNDIHHGQISLARHYKVLALKALTLLRSSGPKALLKKIRRYTSGKPITSDATILTGLAERLETGPLAIVVDHDMGGGANIYRNGHIAERLSQGDRVLLFGFHVASLQYFVEFFEGPSSVRYAIESIEAFVFLLRTAKVRHILYNCAVSFRDPLSIVDMLVTLRQHVHCELLVTIHDYFAICPSHFLIDNKGVFCDVPEKSQCERCLPQHRDGFVSISGVKDITKWRESWSNLLAAADEVRMFSNSSKQLLQRAYPLLDQAAWRIVPHVLHTAMPKVKIQQQAILHIGVIGAIGKHKGSQIIHDMAQEILRKNLPIKITVIGTLEARVPNHIVTVTGPYEAARLSEMIENSGANVFLFPSIWAETFSYVSHELVEMGVPFACFNFGAPADLARSYDKGLILSSMNSGIILDELESFWASTIKMKKEVTWMRKTA